MNIYDFDGTIYDGDTNKDLLKFAAKSHPFRILGCLLKANKRKKEFYRGIATFENVKEAMLSFIWKEKDPQKFINSFVDSHMNKIKPLYKSRQTPNDVIISASYELWIKEFARRLGINTVIATKTDEYGKIIGINCKGDEKIRRLREILPDTPIINAYGDEESDEILMVNAQNGFVVEGNKLIQYQRGYKFKKK